jgi:putative transposase
LHQLPVAHVGPCLSFQPTCFKVSTLEKPNFSCNAVLLRRGKPKALLHHSDQGSQYASEMFQRLLSEHGITCSMSRSGNVWDNSAMESFFSSLKTERVHRKVYGTRDEARADVFDYVERFYNPRRRHSTLGYLSPAEYETTADSA